MRRIAIAAFVAVVATGCGTAGGDGNAQVRGTVTFKGKPVPRGRVYFDVDQTKHPGGQQGYADIADGRYDTARGGKPPSAGAMVIRVEGLHPPAADGTHALLFVPYELRADLPAGRTEKNIDVPASAGDKLPKVTGPPP
jgi:hypothetical protein